MDSNALRRHLRAQRKQTGIGWNILEQDYVLSCVLCGISSVPALKSTLIFKGGTALKKCYFGDYRFSQDLDFSVQGDAPQGCELLSLMEEVCVQASNQVENVMFKCQRYRENQPHPEEQEAFDIRAHLPWQRDFSTTVKVEITRKEVVFLEAEERPTLHSYGSHIDSSLLVYRVEEIIAEKLRALLQFAKKLHERGWGRSRVRDYYDLWRILSEYDHLIEKECLSDLVHRKCSTKDIHFGGVDDLFQEKLMNSLKEWDAWLSPIVPNLPHAEEVIPDLRRRLNEIF